MTDLPQSNPWLYKQLTVEGHHFIHRSDKYKAGLWPDLVIEQVLMQSIKSRGGLTRGRSMSESACTLWVRSMHTCGTLHQAMASLTDHHHATSDQHEELGRSRVNRDFEDLQKVLSFLSDKDPFGGETTMLQSISTGLTANESVNFDNAEQVGRNIQDKLDDQPFHKCTIKPADHVTTLGRMKTLSKLTKIQSILIHQSCFQDEKQHLH